MIQFALLGGTITHKNPFIYLCAYGGGWRWGREAAPWRPYGITGLLAGVISLLLPRGFWGSNLVWLDLAASTFTD